MAYYKEKPIVEKMFELMLELKIPMSEAYDMAVKYFKDRKIKSVRITSDLSNQSK